jgi:hypothetical protein
MTEYAHDAPPAYRPMSALAVISLVLAIVFLIGGMLTFWWIQVLPLLLGIVALRAIGSGERRGNGLAIAGVVIAILGGLGSFACAKAVRTSFSEWVGAFVKAVEEDDRATLAKWTKEGVDLPVMADVWKQRLAAGHARVGAWKKTHDIGGSMWIPIGFVLKPKDVEQVEPRAKDPVVAFWIREECERGDLWLALVPTHGDEGGGLGNMQRATSTDKAAEPKMVVDVLVYVPEGAAAK